MQAVDDGVVLEGNHVEAVDGPEGGYAAEEGRIDDLEFHAGQGLAYAVVAAGAERLVLTGSRVAGHPAGAAGHRGAAAVAGLYLVATLDLFEARARRLVGVFGNNDGPDLRARLTETARVECGGLRFGVVHETGAAQGREKRCAERFPDLDVLVFGHSHIPWDTTAPGGLRLLNPGSPTDRRRQPYCTYMTAEVADGRINGVRLHRVPPRGD